ncbi:MAG: hypothetical protein ACXWLV_05065, partial [Rhizomicrobium sp.]
MYRRELTLIYLFSGEEGLQALFESAFGALLIFAARFVSSLSQPNANCVANVLQSISLGGCPPQRCMSALLI